MNTATLPRCSSADRLMWITPSRVFYAGLLGTPAMHTKGCTIVHVALEAPLRLRLQGGGWQTTEVAVVQPDVPYQLTSEGRHVAGLLVETETVDPLRLPPLLQACGAVEAAAFAGHVRACHARLLAPGAARTLDDGDFDPMFFGAPLPGRRLDPRIERVLARMRSEPAGLFSGEACAREAGLSFSRFLHLFKDEVGRPFRSLRAWKRARSLLHHVHTTHSLVDVALDIGYPDSTHFSHSIRQTYGLKPRDIVAGSRKLRIIGSPAPARA
jgi:AraC-like DNA-binding protein